MQQQNCEDAKDIARQHKLSALKWNKQIACYRDRGTRKRWKQSFKNNFVHLTLFTDQGDRRRKWKEDLERAAAQTATKECPNWESDSEDRKIYDLLQKEAQRTKTPRRGWLNEKAHAWLKWRACNPPQNATWYPALAIQVAYEIFLSSSGKFESFMNYLTKNRTQQIDKFIEAHKSFVAGRMGLTDPCNVVGSSSGTSFDTTVAAGQLQPLALNSTVGTQSNNIDNSSSSSVISPDTTTDFPPSPSSDHNDVSYWNDDSSIYSATDKLLDAQDEQLAQAQALATDAETRANEAELKATRCCQEKTALMIQLADLRKDLEESKQKINQFEQEASRSHATEEVESPKMPKPVKGVENLLARIDTLEYHNQQLRKVLQKFNNGYKESRKSKDALIDQLQRDVREKDERMDRMEAELVEVLRAYNGSATEKRNSAVAPAIRPRPVAPTMTPRPVVPAVTPHAVAPAIRPHPVALTPHPVAPAMTPRPLAMTPRPLSPVLTPRPLAPAMTTRPDVKTPENLPEPILTQTPQRTQCKRRAAAAMGSAPPPKKKAAINDALSMMREIHLLGEFDAPDKFHWMAATVQDDAKPQTQHQLVHSGFQFMPKVTSAPRSVSEATEARAVVVLYARFTTGEVRRSHAFCIDNKQGILVGGAHTLPLELQKLAVIEVHVYNPKESGFSACFVAEPLAEGVSPTFQSGGMDLALLRITHHYNGQKSGKRGAAITNPMDIQDHLASMRIGSTGFEPRDQVSVIRFPIIKGDRTRGCKPKCGRVVARDGSRLHLDFTELQDGDSGALVINGAGEAIAFLMGRPPNRQCTTCRCLQALYTPDNSIYYAQLLGTDEPQAFIQKVMLLNKVDPHLSTDPSKPWGEYKIKQRIEKLEKIQGLETGHKQVVAEFVAHFKQILEVRRTGKLQQEQQQEQQRVLQEAERKANETINRLETAQKAAESQQKAKQRQERNSKEESVRNLKMEVGGLKEMVQTLTDQMRSERKANDAKTTWLEAKFTEVQQELKSLWEKRKNETDRLDAESDLEPEYDAGSDPNLDAEPDTEPDTDTETDTETETSSDTYTDCGSDSDSGTHNGSPHIHLDGEAQIQKHMTTGEVKSQVKCYLAAIADIVGSNCYTAFNARDGGLYYACKGESFWDAPKEYLTMLNHFLKQASTIRNYHGKCEKVDPEIIKICIETLSQQVADAELAEAIAETLDYLARNDENMREIIANLGIEAIIKALRQHRGSEALLRIFLSRIEFTPDNVFKTRIVEAGGCELALLAINMQCRPEKVKSASKLPAGWLQFQDEEGRTYFENVVIKMTQWTDPTVKWQKLVDTAGRAYYYNQSTREAQWNQPVTFNSNTNVVLTGHQQLVQRLLRVLLEITCNSHQNTELAVNNAGIQVLNTCMATFPGVAGIISVVVAICANWVLWSNPNKLKVRDSCGKSIISAISTHHSNLWVYKHAIQAIGNMALVNSANVLWFTQHHAVKAVAEHMNQHTNDDEAKEIAIKVIGNFAKSSEVMSAAGEASITAMIYEEGGAHAILYSMKANADKPSLLLAAIETLHDICLEIPTAEKLVQDGLVQVIVDTMKRYDDDEKMVGPIMGLIAPLCYLTTAADKFVKLNGIQMFISAMDTHAKNEGILTKGQTSLNFLAINEASREAIIEHGGLKMILTLVGKLRKNKEFLDQALRTLAQMASSPTTCDCIITEHGMHLLTQLIEEHKKDPYLLAHIFRLLGFLASRTEGLRKLVHHNGIHLIISAISVHVYSRDQELMLHAIKILELIVRANPDFAATVNKNRGASVIRQIMQTYSHVPDIKKSSHSALVAVLVDDLSSETKDDVFEA